MCDWSSSVGLEKRLSTLETNSLPLSTPTPFPRGVSQRCIPAQSRTPTFPRAAFPSTHCNFFSALSGNKCAIPHPQVRCRALPGAGIPALCRLWHCRGRAQTWPREGRRCLSLGKGRRGKKGRGSLSVPPKSHAQPAGLGCYCGRFSTCPHSHCCARSDQTPPSPRDLQLSSPLYLFISNSLSISPNEV